MTIWESIILGIVQGLTEFLPVSSSGHLVLASEFLHVDVPDNAQFTVVVHGATVLSTIVVFARELLRLFKGFFRLRLNEETIFVINLLISMAPVAFVGIFLGDEVKALFNNVPFVGTMLIVTAALLTFAHFAKPRQNPITPKRAFIIGLAQAVAVLPGLSRSGSTISTGLMLGVKKEETAKFSFLMVLLPVIGANILDALKMPAGESLPAGILLAGFAAAFVTGTLACRWMIKIVSRGRLIWFAAYCLAVGIAALIFA